MQRQTSILSFLSKPLPERSDSEKNGLDRSSLVAEKQDKGPSLEEDVRGTDTPPEKPLRRLLPAGMARTMKDVDDGLVARPFSSIMHKFVKGEVSARRNPEDHESFMVHSEYELFKDIHAYVKPEIPSEEQTKAGKSLLGFSAFSSNLDLDTDVQGPETPAMQRHVPRLKRVQEIDPDSAHKPSTSALGPSKRLKSALDTSSGTSAHDKEPETVTSKFEWLNSSSIRDGNGRRPNDPLYDKTTLFIPPNVLQKMTASQRQYWGVKCQYMDVLLFFKVGKFYELYEIDAEIGHRELDWKITNSGVGKCRQVGISEAGIDDAVQKLIARGYKVGRVEQLETSDQAKARGAASVIQRKLVNVATPSTATDGTIGAEAVHLLALKEEHSNLDNGATVYGFAFLDYAALKFWVGLICDDNSCAALGTLLMQVSPREILYESRGLSKETHKTLTKYASAGSMKTELTALKPSDNFLDASGVRDLINCKGYFGGSSGSWSSAFENSVSHDLALCALGGLIHHLSRLMLDDALHNGELLSYHVYRSCLRMDGQTLINLEIFSNNFDGGLSGTLYKHLDQCITASGKRLLRRWICHPLKDVADINDRLDIVEMFINSSGIISILYGYLRKLPDLERLLGKIRSIVGSSSTVILPFVGERVLKQRIKAFGSLVNGLRIGIDLLNALEKESHKMPSLKKVADIPTLRGLDELLHQFEVALNDDFPNYQNHDVKESDAETLAVLVELFAGKAAEWSRIINALNCIDVLQSFAAAAVSSSRCMSRPVFVAANSDPENLRHSRATPLLLIKGLWHPYAIADNENGLVPNDISLGEDLTTQHPSALLLTGPNMGGKSTLLRATCLAVILAQLGCYVPCGTCLLSPVDTIFTRLGATDRIMSGESTFYVECSETASILRDATQDSLVLLDELGRGTSTFDGYAIAYAVFRHLVENVFCRLLFATHYHSLTKEFASHPRVSLQHMACALRSQKGSCLDGGEDLIFLYRLAKGACPESYGLQVARIAGIPKPVVEVAAKVGKRMKLMISENFKSSEGRSQFSTLHEEWLKTLLAVSSLSESCWNEDASDTLLCLWHEMKNLYKSAT